MYHYYEDVNWGLLRLWGERSGKSILDVGCGYGTTSARLRTLGNRVTGIESSEAAVKTASERLDRVIAADLHTAELKETFDCILFADVLEHLPWPAEVLQRYLRFLAPDGSVIISLPNVGLWSTRLSLLVGRFEYADTGVLDRTHLRFFTRKTARRLIESAGLTVVRHTYNPGILRPFAPLAKMGMRGNDDPSAIVESAAYKTYLRTVYPVERALALLWPGALAFQMIFEARRA
jgi:2-polyprenyl-3-methyl-5-hydroxy-6-metoxy-1,4-benzoquinol methylase